MSGEDETAKEKRFEGTRHKEDTKSTVLSGFTGEDDEEEDGVAGRGYGKGGKGKKGKRRRGKGRRQSAMPMLPAEKVKVS